MAMYRSTRTVKGQATVQTHCYVTSLPNANASRIAKAVRSHWAIENGMRWILDMAFREDGSRIRTERATENSRWRSTVRRSALSRLKNIAETDAGVTGKRTRSRMEPPVLGKTTRPSGVLARSP
jgi:predicted transposase YbfD/YdcC